MPTQIDEARKTLHCMLNAKLPRFTAFGRTWRAGTSTKYASPRQYAVSGEFLLVEVNPDSKWYKNKPGAAKPKLLPHTIDVLHIEGDSKRIIGRINFNGCFPIGGRQYDEAYCRFLLPLDSKQRAVYNAIAMAGVLRQEAAEQELLALSD